MKITPSLIEVMLHYYISSDPHPRADAPAVQHNIQDLRLAGMIEVVAIDGCYTATAKGKAWVEMLCHTPLPVQTWADPR